MDKQKLIEDLDKAGACINEIADILGDRLDKEIARSVSASNFLKNSFIWSDTDQGLKYWESKHSLLELIETNLKSIEEPDKEYTADRMREITNQAMRDTDISQIIADIKLAAEDGSSSIIIRDRKLTSQECYKLLLLGYGVTCFSPTNQLISWKLKE